MRVREVFLFLLMDSQYVGESVARTKTTGYSSVVFFFLPFFPVCAAAETKTSWM